MLSLEHYNEEIARLVSSLQIETGYEVPMEDEILDARRPPTQAELRYHEEELKSAEAALDKQLEYLDDINSGSETVHDYFTYHTSPQNTNNSPPKASPSFIDIQTLPFSQLKEDLNRLDRCSSNDSGLGTSMSPTRAIEESSSGSSNSGTSSDDASTPTPAPVPQPRRRFPRLGVSAVLNSNAISSDCSSSDEQSRLSASTPTPTAAPRTSTPSGSPSKLSETPQSPVISKQSESALLPPDFLNPAIIPNSSASTQNIEDLLYPGMKSSKATSSSGLAKKLLSSLKSKTGSGLNRMRVSLAELTKTEKDKAMMESQIIQKIMSESENPTQPEDFSLHMIAEASLARLTEMTEPAQTSSNNKKNTPRAAVPPTGITIQTPVPTTQKMVTPEPTRKSRRSKRVDPAEAARKSRHQSRRRKVISEVKKQVQSAHQMAPVPLVPPVATSYSPANAQQQQQQQQLKKVYKGQLPQYRNGQLDWNYLWFFSDSSTTNSSDKSHLNVTSPVTSITSSESDSDSENNDRDQKRAINRRRRVRATTTGHNRAQSGSPAKEAKKRRIRRLAPPRDDNIQLLGMI